MPSGLAANSEFFAEPQPVDDLERMEKLFFEGVPTRQLHDVFLIRPDESGGQGEEVGSNGVHRDRVIFAGETNPLEPMHDIGGKEQQLD